MNTDDMLVGDRYRLLIDAVTDYAIYMLDPDGLVASWNPGARRFKGYRDHEIIGQHFSRFYTEEDRATCLPARALETAAKEGRFENEGWRVRKDGTRFWAHVVIDPILHPTSGRVLGYAKITRDLTDRKKQDEALRQSEQSFRLLVQGVTDYAIYMLDREGIVTNWNAGAERIKGYRPEEIIGRHFSVFYTQADRARGDCERALAIARESGSFQTDGWRVRKNGERFWASVALDPIRDDTGQIIGFAKITRDMSERRQAEQALEVAREALYQSQKMESLGQLTGGIAHDFNNLLNAVVGSLELLRKQVTDDKQLSLIGNALKGATRGITLTQRMLAFARKQELQPKAVNIYELVAGMTDLLSRSLGPSIEFDTRFPASLKPAFADPNQLELAILNLAVNARDAMPSGGRITISASNETILESVQNSLAAGNYVRIAVEDSGFGMDAETLAKASEPFFTTKGVGKGTGLGLPMVLGTAQQLGGRLDLASQPGKGTTATLWLRASEPAAALPAEDRLDVDGGGDSPLSVLAVDDDALVLMNTVALLEDLGHTVVEAASGQEALKRLEEGQIFDLIITDHAMPHMTGGQLIAEVSRRWPDIPIILATGYADLPDGLQAGVRRLGKPFWQSDLQKAIADVTGA
ncbi:hybrid sensor histidine kinase/response regulator [Bosea sp. PAMC 26642]|uniref:hybrid sensor histidine kinase/response regulator n=1 Tax=Bosea sp. (strain PAMC 26642) TaxID=1792307 RepID=UPI00076FE647|nr:PAS domain-containing sensor histidine kinase [Bosea sp. PAMC 26642]AMJ61640.1 hybrid sensor histidine kinase/response regulator [Bosea sp. PAMC 26642]